MQIEPAMVYMTAANPGEVKGPHLHKKRWGYLTCLKGRVVFIIKKEIEDARNKRNYTYEEFILDSNNPQVLEIPPNVPQAHVNISDSEAILINICSPAWHPDNQDNYNDGSFFGSLDNIGIWNEDLSDEVLTSNINDFIKDNSPNLTTTINNLNATSLKMKDVSNSISEVDLNLILTNLDSTISNLNKITHKLNQGEGTVGKLLYDDGLFKNLDNATKNLEELIEDIKLNPKRYVHFSIFGKKSDK